MALRPYEVMIILDAGLEEEAVRSILDRASASLTGAGAEITRTEKWGKRRFAYELDHRWEGYYVLLHTNAEPEAVSGLDRLLSLADEVIRHKVIRLPEKVAARASSGGPVGGGGEPEAEANGATE